jgi:osmoprotectant transport system permease protein
MWATRNRHVRSAVLGITGVIQTIPSLALLGLLVVPLAALAAAFPALRDLGIRGIGAAPGFIALTLYALLPVVRNTYVGLSEVDPAALDAGRGMGMSRAQLLFRVEFPLAAPLVAEGVRTAAVLLIGITTLTVFAGARNLGILIFEGLGQFAPDLILLGALPTIALAVAADLALGALARLLTPKGVRA